MSNSIGDAVTPLLNAAAQAEPNQLWDEAKGREVAEKLAAAGWLAVGVPESLGGPGGELDDIIAVVDAITASGWPSPAADVLLVTNTVLREAGFHQSTDSSPIFVLPSPAHIDLDGTVSCTAEWVPWAPWASSFLALADDPRGGGTVAVLVDAYDAQIVTRRSLNGAPWGAVTVTSAPAQASHGIARPVGESIALVRTAGALARSLQLSSALGRVRDLTIEYSCVRMQFGRSLSRFQAVQQHLASLAALVSTAQSAVAEAVTRVGSVTALLGDPRVSTAKVQTSVAAGAAARIAHQVHGAIGITVEHELHRHTQALWTWRDEFGDEFGWARLLADDISAADDVWTWVTR